MYSKYFFCYFLPVMKSIALAHKYFCLRRGTVITYLSGEFLNEDLHNLPLKEEDLLAYLSQTLKEESEADSSEDQKSLQAKGFKVFAAQLQVGQG